MKILIGSAWPYANGSLHIGHIAALLPADVLARYHRAKGDDVYFVSGSDCHGTPVAIRAKQENKTPGEISNYFHREFCDCFAKLGFSYDYYGKTSDDTHKTFVTEFHKQMYKSQYIVEKSVPQAYCENCKTFLADRFVVGKCPSCGEDARGDQCDACGSVLEAEDLTDPLCSICGRPPVFKQTKHLFLKISALEKELKTYIDSHPEWRKNASAFSYRYIREGLRDRAITRDLDWGIDVPRPGYEGKKIYIWAENVLGYLSASKAAAENRGESFEELWGKDARHYYVHGKDNIPFHTIILPSLLLSNGGGRRLPDVIVSSEYLTLGGRRISTSRNYAIWAKDIVDRYDPDSLRFFFISNGPEKKDADFTWRQYVNNHNGELLGAYGNFINRSLVFISKYYSSVVPAGKPEKNIQKDIAETFESVGRKIEQCGLRDALDEVFGLVHGANQYFDVQKPWVTRTADPSVCENTLYNCVLIAANLAVLLSPFLPFSSAKVMKWLGVTEKWEPQPVPVGYQIPQPEILFERIDQKAIDDETAKLKN